MSDIPEQQIVTISAELLRYLVAAAQTLRLLRTIGEPTESDAKLAAVIAEAGRALEQLD